jgi:hypothetical protein
MTPQAVWRGSDFVTNITEQKKTEAYSYFKIIRSHVIFLRMTFATYSSQLSLFKDVSFVKCQHVVTFLSPLIQLCSKP